MVPVRLHDHDQILVNKMSDKSYHVHFAGSLCLSEHVGSHHAIECEEVTYNVSQTLWPDHCIQNTEDAKLAPDIIVKESDVIIKKGDDCEVKLVLYGLRSNF